jgi:hypothetical protein
MLEWGGFCCLTFHDNYTKVVLRTNETKNRFQEERSYHHLATKSCRSLGQQQNERTEVFVSVAAAAAAAFILMVFFCYIAKNKLIFY